MGDSAPSREATSGVGSVLGVIQAADLGVVLAAEPLIVSGSKRLPKDDRAAGGVAFFREPVTIEHLGRLALGAPNADDAQIDEVLAGDALEYYAAAGGGSLVVPRTPVAVATPAALARLSERTGVHVVRGTVPDVTASQTTGRITDVDGSEHALMAEITEAAYPAGIIGAVPVPEAGDTAGELTLTISARVAARTGVALLLTVRRDMQLQRNAEIDDVRRAVRIAGEAGLDPHRIVVAGASKLIADRNAGVGVDESLRATLIAVSRQHGIVWAWDDLGRIPSVRTRVSDHDIALTVMAFAEAGLGQCAALSSGITHKHRLTAFGGNGLEFVPQQFLPYLRHFGAEDALIDAVGGGNLAVLLTRTGVDHG